MNVESDSPDLPPGEARVFGTLNPSLFRVFTGRNGNFFAELLEYLDAEVLGFAGEPVPRKAAIRAIGEFIDRKARDLAFDDEEAAGGGQPEDPREADPRRYIAFERLRKCGWFVEHRDRYRRIVDFDPDARLLFQALLELKAGRLRSYGGEVLQVLTLVQAAAADPADKSEAIRNAARSARGFMNHLRSISGAMRKVEQIIVAETSVRGMFGRFFDEFVSRHLIADYKQLTTQNNPFRFRARLIREATGVLEDPALMRALAEGYVREARARDVREAELALEDELALIVKVFRSVDDHLDLIAATNQRVEKRIRTTVKFLDRIAESRTGAFVAAIEGLGRVPLSGAAEIDVEHRFLAVEMPVGDRHLYQAQARRRPAEPTRTVRRPKDQGLVVYQFYKRSYAERARVTPQKIVDYLERQLRGRTEIAGSQMAIESLDDFFVFERLRDLPYRFHERTIDFELSHLQCSRIDNEWISCPDFTIRRRPAAIASGNPTANDSGSRQPAEA